MSDTGNPLFQMLQLMIPSEQAFRLQKSFGLTYWVYDPDSEEMAWCERKKDGTFDFEAHKADIKSILLKYDAEDRDRVFSAISEGFRNDISKTYQITMQVDTPRPTLFALRCVKYTLGSKVLALGLMRNYEKDNQYKTYLSGMRKLLSEFCASSPSGVLLVDNEGQVITLNKRFSEVFGIVDHKKLIGSNIRALERDVGNTLVTKIAQAVENGEQMQGSQKFFLGDRSAKALNYRLFNFSVENNNGGIAFAGEPVPAASLVHAESILDSILNPLLVVDRETRKIAYANSAARTTLGIEPDHIGEVRLTDRLMSTSDIAEIEGSLSSTGREPGRTLNISTYADAEIQYLVRASLAQTNPDAQAIFEFMSTRAQISSAAA
jgi:PAS domain-containing protein